MADVQRSEDLTLAPNEFALVLDRTNGVVHTYSGPSNTSLSAQEVPVLFDYTSKRFVPTDMARAKQLKKLAPEGWYIILKNPAAKGDQPEEGKKARIPDLLVGHKVNIPGPTSFALWPGQMAQVVQGHHLRQDEYLIARVYDGEAARKSFGLLPAPAEDAPAPKESSLVPKDLTPGYLFIIKGTEASFYVPPTGIEVVRDEDDKARVGTAAAQAAHKYVRSAVSLERLEYCLLRDQDGNKRYVRGPAVVFPKPTEAFVTNADGTSRKFKAIELGVKNGIHVKVIADYKDEESGATIKAGSELFLKGEDTPIYFPREEHSIIKYGDSDVNFGVAIPPGEARYVMQRLAGDIRLEKGPTVFLPDPRTECIVRRILDPRLCALMYPGNSEALQVNQTLAAAASADRPGLDAIGEQYILEASAAPAGYDQTRSVTVNSLYAATATTLPSSAEARFHGDVMNRRGQYRPPRTITLNSKYEGAVAMGVYEGYAVMLTTKRGNRRVIVGPQTALLEYDEDPHVLTLSTGKPKSMDRPYRTVYLQIANNYVTDIVEAETQDYCKVQVKLSYRLNFEGDPERWFSVENYVKLLCDNMRSRIRNRVRRVGIKEFYHEATDLLRDLILGASSAEGSDTKGRPGRFFEENGMRIFDVEVLEVKLDKDLQTLLEAQERATMRQALELEELQRRATFAAESKDLQARIIDATEAVKLREEAAKRQRLQDEAATKQLTQEVSKATQEAANLLAQLVRDNKKADHTLQVDSQQAVDALRIAMLKAETAATKERMAAITPDLVASLQAFGDQATLERLAEAMGAQAFLKTLGGESIVDILAKALQGSSIADRLPAALNGRAGATAKQLTT